MYTLSESTFSTYAIPEDEAFLSATLTSAQYAVYHNMRTSIAEQILALDINPLNPQDFQQQHAYLKGQLYVIDELLRQHKLALEFTQQQQQTTDVNQTQQL